MRVAVVDDEALARARLTRLLAALDDIEVVASCDSADALLALLRSEPIDALWLDIRMPGLDGLELAALLGDKLLHIVFVTAHRQHAVDAFAVGAVDYLLKPVAATRVRQAAQRLLRHHRHGHRGTEPRQLAIDTATGVVFVQPRHITHASYDGQLLTLHLLPPAVPEKVDTTWSLNALMERLPPALLERVHRRHLLNLAHVERLERTAAGGYLARVRGGGEVEVSRQAGRRLRRRFGW